MKRFFSGLIVTTILSFGLAPAANAQSADDPDGLLGFELIKLVQFPDQPRDFDFVVFLIIYGSSEFDDPFMVDDFNLTFVSTDDNVDAGPL